MAGKFEFLRDITGNNAPPAIQEYPIAASQTLLIGDLVYLSSGQVTKAGASTASVLGVMAEAVTTPDANTMVKVYPIMPGQVWRATADADASSVLLTNKTMDINATTQTVDVADTSNGCIIIVAVDATDTTKVDVMFTAFDLAAA